MQNSKKSNIETAILLLRTGEIRKLIEKILDRISYSALKPVFFYDRFYILSYGERPSRIKSRLSSTIICRANIEDLSKLRELLDRKDEYEKRFKRGDTVVLAKHNGRFIGMKWIKFVNRQYEETDDCMIKLPGNSAWTYDAYVDPRFRLSGLWVKITDEVVKYANAHSAGKIYCAVKALNEISLSTHIRYGSRIQEQVIHFRLAFVRIYLHWHFNQEKKRSFAGARIRLTSVKESADKFHDIAVNYFS